MRWAIILPSSGTPASTKPAALSESAQVMYEATLPYEVVSAVVSARGYPCKLMTVSRHGTVSIFGSSGLLRVANADLSMPSTGVTAGVTAVMLLDDTESSSKIQLLYSISDGRYVKVALGEQAELTSSICGIRASSCICDCLSGQCTCLTLPYCESMICIPGTAYLIGSHADFGVQLLVRHPGRLSIASTFVNFDNIFCDCNLAQHLQRVLPFSSAFASVINRPLGIRGARMLRGRWNLLLLCFYMRISQS